MHAPRHIARHHDGPASAGFYDVVTLSGAVGAAQWRWWLRQHEQPVATLALADEPAEASRSSAPPSGDHDPAYTVVTLSAADEDGAAVCAGIVVEL
jgi:hypothetical protein